VAFWVAISSSAPHLGGASLWFPAWMRFFELRDVPTERIQLFCEAASVGGSQVPALRAMG